MSGMDDYILAALDAIWLATARSPDTAVMVIIDDPTHGCGGFVHVPTGSRDEMTVLGSLGAVALQGTRRQQAELFDAIGMFLLAPDAAEA
jgi:hypothetical protein